MFDAHVGCCVVERKETDLRLAMPYMLLPQAPPDAVTGNLSYGETDEGLFALAPALGATKGTTLLFVGGSWSVHSGLHFYR